MFPTSKKDHVQSLGAVWNLHWIVWSAHCSARTVWYDECSGSRVHPVDAESGDDDPQLGSDASVSWRQTIRGQLHEEGGRLCRQEA